MEKLRISIFATIVVPIVTSFSCGGSDNPGSPSNGTKDASAGSSSGGGGSSGTAGSTMGMSGTAGTMGIGGRRDGGGLPPAETIVLDSSCPDFKFSFPQGGVKLPDGGTFTIPDGGFKLPDGGTFKFPTLKGCCDHTGVCGYAVTQISNCLTPGEARMFGMGMGSSFDAGPSKACTYTGK
jgi:hypothetical protein